MELKKSPKANLENKRMLFIEIGLVVALVIVLAAFEYKTYEKNASFLDAEVQQVIEEEQIPVTLETPPRHPKLPRLLYFPMPLKSLKTISPLKTTLSLKQKMTLLLR